MPGNSFTERNLKSILLARWEKGSKKNCIMVIHTLCTCNAASNCRTPTCNCNADLEYHYRYSLYWQCLECAGYVFCGTLVFWYIWRTTILLLVSHVHVSNLHVSCTSVYTNHASRLVCRNDPDLKWQSMYYAQNSSNSAVDGLHVK